MSSPLQPTFRSPTATELSAQRALPLSAPCRRVSRFRKYSGFTLIELLVVIAIIGILITLGLPMLKGMNKSNSMIAANRQLLDDINYARQRAIADHTSVYILFIPPEIILWNPPTDPNVNKMMVNLFGGQYTTYALFSMRSVGEQPGRNTPRYLTEWRSLPAGIYIATNKFTTNTAVAGMAPPFYYTAPNRPEFPFPVATNFAQARTDFHFPHFGFNYLGQLIYRTNGVDQLITTANQMYIPLARGSLFYQRDANGNYTAAPPDISETAGGTAYYANYNSTNAQGGVALPSPDDSKSYNQIYIDPLTGRAKVQNLKIQ